MAGDISFWVLERQIKVWLDIFGLNKKLLKEGGSGSLFVFRNKWVKVLRYWVRGQSSVLMEDISLSCNFFLIKVSTSYFLLSKTLYCKQWSMETVIIPQEFWRAQFGKKSKANLKKYNFENLLLWIRIYKAKSQPICFHAKLLVTPLVSAKLSPKY